MERLFEYIVPIMVVLWVIGKFLFSRNEQEDDGAPQPSQFDQDEQARRIQEEIRRKIAERRRQSESGPAPGAPPPIRHEAAPPPVMRETAPPPLKPSPYSTEPMGRERHSARPRPVEPTGHVHHEEPQRGRDLFAELAEQEERMRETQRRAEAARAQARQRISNTAGSSRRYSRVPRVTGSMREDLVATFRDPIAARKAVLYSEVLGTPVGQRRQGQMRPSWEL